MYDCCLSSAWHVLYCPPHSRNSLLLVVLTARTLSARERTFVIKMKFIWPTLPNERFSPSATCFVCIFCWCWMWHRELLIVSTQRPHIQTVLYRYYRTILHLGYLPLYLFKLFVYFQLFVYSLELTRGMCWYTSYWAKYTEKYHDLAQLWLVLI